jgi:mannan endo-1,6-alpha-mannosidase
MCCTDSIRQVSSQVAHGLMKYYTGNNTGDVPGNLPDPYYWWEAGAMFGEMVEYWYYTGDTTYNAEVKQAMLHQVGENNDYMPANQTKSLVRRIHIHGLLYSMLTSLGK